MFIDAHCHLEMCKDPEQAIKNAKEKNVILITQGVNVESNRWALASGSHDNVKVALGLYPLDCLKMSEDEISKELEFIESQKDKIVAIGEVGLDFKEDNKEHDKQKSVFAQFIELSKDLDVPIIVHSRKAELECIEMLEDQKASKVVMHCFSGSFNLIRKIITNKWFLTIPTNVTFSEHFQKVIELAPIEQLLCETDSPYLHPEKKRDNEPMNVIESYKKIAEIKKLPLEQVENQIENNYRRLFEKS